MDDAFLAELRASAPPAPERLRARVEAIAAREPRGRASWREWFQPRRALVVLAPAAFAAMLAVAVGHGVFDSGPAARESASAFQPQTRKALGSERARAGIKTPSSGTPRSVGGGSTDDVHGALPAPNTARLQALPANTIATAPPPATTRKQDYRATLTVRLPSTGRMSDAVKDAINATRAWGGYVVSAQYAASRNGDANLVVRVPIQHVQAAVQRFSNLGTLTAQDVSIRDVQAKLNAYTRQLLDLREQIAKLRVQLTHATTDAERAAIELRISRATRAAAGLRAEQKALSRQAAFATVTLTLTTRGAAAAAPAKQGDVERTLRDAASILALELAYGLFALIVAAPFALLALLIWMGSKVARRRADDRLLGST
jgi:hypothetical protein